MLAQLTLVFPLRISDLHNKQHRTTSQWTFPKTRGIFPPLTTVDKQSGYIQGNLCEFTSLSVLISSTLGSHQTWLILKIFVSSEILKEKTEASR